ncbi:MAG TPA: hypothetical protein VEC99_03980, partial [Clostridia bacterium]|nr:hypothetical protein [Clostridia bacterium]
MPFLGLAQTSLIFNYGSDWQYRLGVAEASSPDSTAWRRPGFTPTGWSSGPAPIGYAEPAS